MFTRRIYTYVYMNMHVYTISVVDCSLPMIVPVCYLKHILAVGTFYLVPGFYVRRSTIQTVAWEPSSDAWCNLSIAKSNITDRDWLQNASKPTESGKNSQVSASLIWGQKLQPVCSENGTSPQTNELENEGINFPFTWPIITTRRKVKMSQENHGSSAGKCTTNLISSFEQIAIPETHKKPLQFISTVRKLVLKYSVGWIY